MDNERITYFGVTDARNKKVNFGIKAKDRTKHVYVIGKTGMGKSTLLENMAVQDIKNGEGLAFIDPHGKTAELLLEYVPAHRMKDVVYFAPFDIEYPISFNVLESVDPDKRHLVVSGLMSTFKKIWQDAWSARMEYILTNTLLALLEYPDATLLGVNRMLSDKVYRNEVVSHVTDSAVKAFWTQEFANYTERMAAEAVPAIQNKIGQFTANALIRNMIGQPKSTFDIRKMMDEGKIFIINLSKGRIGESNANLLGGMLITKIYLAALSRADVPDRVLKTLPNFYLFVDEFQSFANESFADILSEARKYKLNLTIAHQYIEQMEDEVRAAVFGNVGTMVIFRVGAYDAEILEKEFAPQFTAEDIVNLGIFQIYLKLMIDGISSQPFSATTLPPIAKPESSSMYDVIENSRAQFANQRSIVEVNINKWMEPMKPPSKVDNRADGRQDHKQDNKQENKNTDSKGGDSHSRQTTNNTNTTHNNTAHNNSNNKFPVVERPKVPEPQIFTHNNTHNTHGTHSTQSSENNKTAAKSENSTSNPTNVQVNTENTQGRENKSDQPFKKAFEELKTVPLSHLNNPHQNRNNGKTPDPKKINDLKNALASALQNSKTKPEEKKIEAVKNENIESSKAHHNKDGHIEPSKKHNSNEVPENVLRDILKVE